MNTALMAQLVEFVALITFFLGLFIRGTKSLWFLLASLIATGFSFWLSELSSFGDFDLTILYPPFKDWIYFVMIGTGIGSFAALACKFSTLQERGEV